jgi:hypothetical protein
MGTAKGRGTFSGSEAEVGAARDGSVHGGPVQEDAIPVHGGFQLQDGIEGQREVFHRAGQQRNGTSGASNGFAFLEVVQVPLELLTVDTVADAVVKDVPKELGVDLCRPPRGKPGSEGGSSTG